MEEDGSVATSCMAVTRFVDYQALCHDPLFSSSPCPPGGGGGGVDSAPSTMDSSEVASLLTDMLSADFPLYHTTGSRYTVPDILQFPADQASKITLLQMIEETDAATATSSYSHMKLPVLEEPCDHHKLMNATVSSSEKAAIPSPAAPAPVSTPGAPASTSAAAAQPVANASAQVSSSARSGGGLGEMKPCKEEPADSILQEVLAPLITGNKNKSNNSSKILLGSNTSSENSADNKVQGGVLSQSSSGTETPNPHQPQQHRPKRKRIKSCKNSQEVESQRQTHIAVERNRRKQMNEHLNVLRSLMPGSYVQRGDQASIIGGAIEFVKELEQLLQCLQAQKRRRIYSEAFSPKPSPSVTSMLQQQQQQQPYFTTPPPPPPPPPPPYSPHQADSSKFVNDNFYEPVKEVVAEAKSEAADIEVKMVGSTDAVVKILSKRRPGQLLKTISALENMCMTIVHTNITTIEQTVLYSFTVRIGMESRLAVEEIAEAIQRAFTLIHNSSTCSSAA